MYQIECRNVNEALAYGLNLLEDDGEREESRVGPVLVSPMPVCTKYNTPEERVLFSSLRDANPFFHLFESLWMLAGRDDVEFVHRFAPMMLYSDDNKRLNGAYGFRWRRHFGYDQVEEVISELKTNPASRRCVIAMWDAQDTRTGGVNYPGDLRFGRSGGKDIPCNTHVYFRARGKELDMTVCNRSNDIVWGAYGANAVHFSVLQEYIALACGFELGHYYQIANNFHAYIEREDTGKLLTALNTSPSLIINDKYTDLDLPATPLYLTDRREFDRELRMFMTYGSEHAAYTNPIFTLAVEMLRSHTLYKMEKLDHAMAGLEPYRHTDWGLAAYDWLERRYEKRMKKENA